MTSALRYVVALLGGLLCTLVLFPAAHAQVVLQAEDASSTRCDTPPQAPDGTQWVSLTQRELSRLDFTVNGITSAGMYTLMARYTTSRTYVRTLSIQVNGEDITQAQFPAAVEWATQEVIVPLLAGTNHVVYAYEADDNGYVSIDHLTVSTARTPGYSSGSAAAIAWPTGLGVDQFTGTAQFALPLFSFTAPGISIPIGLGYAATGVQVADDGGGAGMNWALQADIAVRRIVRGLPDDLKVENAQQDYRYGWLYPAPINPDNLPEPAAVTTCAAQQQARSLLDQLGSRTRSASGAYTMYDPEPDIFFYSLPGHSGRFIFDKQGIAHTFPYDPITIEWGSASTPSALSIVGIERFTVRTPEGTTYVLGTNDQVLQQTSPLSYDSQYFLGDYLAYKLVTASLGAPPYIQYSTAWHASTVTSAAGGYVQFEYDTEPSGSSVADMPFSIIEHRFLKGIQTGVPGKSYSTTIRRRKNYRITRIASSTMAATFEWSQDNPDGSYYIRAINLLALPSLFYNSMPGEALLKRYSLDYTLAVPDYPNELPWFDEKGTTIDDAPPRHFLRQLSLSTGYTTEPLYTFAYAQVGPYPIERVDSYKRRLVRCGLPPQQAVNKDYWGFYNANGAKTLIPQLYLYPQLMGLASSLAAAPYCLYELTDNPAYAGTGGVLPGADRRPAADFATTLAGTLTQITVGTGGTVTLEYEPHTFYDALAQQTTRTGGVRVRTIKVADPITRVETRRDYFYQRDDGKTSGVLLHAPRFAFAMPAAGTTTLQQWQTGTVRCGEDMGADPLESRLIGYSRVTEILPGQGRTITDFTVPAGADKVQDSGIGAFWTRPPVGVASVADNTGACPSLTPLPAGADLYPFALASAFDYQRGLPTRILSLAEPIGNNPAARVRQQEFTYAYRALAPYTAVGVAYERVGDSPNSPYLYAKSRLSTGYQLVPREEANTLYSANGPAVTRKTIRLYNAHGWLATIAQQLSDQSYQRTRYRYLADCAPTSPNAGTPEERGMYWRLRNGMGAEVVETISEVVKNGVVLFKEASLQTYATEPPLPFSSDLRSRLHRTWHYAAPPPLSSRTDSTDLLQGALAGNQAWLVSAISEVDRLTLAPLSTYVKTGRQTQARHLGYRASLPVLQIIGANASEVVFSDFESEKDYDFTLSGGWGGGTTAAPRTGLYSASLTSSKSLTCLLPTSVAPRYRLVWWARPSDASTPPVTFTAAILTGNAGIVSLPAQTVTLAGSDWQRLEVLLPDLSAIPAGQRTDYQLQLSAAGPVQVDDVLLLPADATATSTTYDVSLGKTSETTDRGRTTYYEYNAAGRLALVRDHNHAIVRQVERVVAGRRSDNTLTPTFAVEGEEEGKTIEFTAYGPRRTDLEYQWDFGDGSPATAFSESERRTLHPFPVTGQDCSYWVTLRIKVKNSSLVYVGKRQVFISKLPFTATATMTGVIQADICHLQLPITNDGSGAPYKTVYEAVPSIPGNYTYSWDVFEYNGLYPSWRPLQGENGKKLTRENPHSGNYYRCHVGGTGMNSNGATTNAVGVELYRSQDPCAH